MGRPKPHWQVKQKPKPRAKTKSTDHTKHPVEISPGRGPHAGELRCVQCNIHLKWLSKKHYKILV
jgi:hypothetical protein